MIERGSAGDPDGLVAARLFADGTLRARRLEPGEDPGLVWHRGREHAACAAAAVLTGGGATA